MTFDPNAQDMHYDPYVEGHSDLPPRTSILAVFSAIVPVACCIPGIGVLAILMSAMSLTFISRSHGRLSGRGAAGFGLILGLAVTVIQGAIFFGVLQGWKYYKTQMVTATGSFFSALDQRDYTTARGMLDASADSDITDERLESFIVTLQEIQGSVNGATSDWSFIGSAFEDAYKNARQNSNYTAQPNGDLFVPVALTRSDGTSLLSYIGFDADALGGPNPLILDAAVYVSPGKVITLRDDGPGHMAALAMNAEPLTFEEALKQDALPAADADADFDLDDGEPEDDS